jgi:hypothetical protein
VPDTDNARAPVEGARALAARLPRSFLLCA